ncbi:MAG: ribosomal RNA small subunit methyltransferase A [Candidatus Promineofilum sp.]|nr:ribosomal RNA small subunit methyltransferase A [Promineifilum sp.]
MHPKQLLDRYHIEPKKSLGQNFLHDEGLLGRIVAAAELSPDDEVLEVGPGLGALTRVLARAARRVVAVELDGRLLPVLESELGGLGNVELVHGDVLQLDPADWFAAPYVVVANVPYYITGAILRHLLGGRPRPRRLVLTVQREVADRLTARPPEMSLLAVSVQYYGRARLVSTVKAGAFWPRPEVDSAVVRIDVDPRHLGSWAGEQGGGGAGGNAAQDPLPSPLPYDERAASPAPLLPRFPASSSTDTEEERFFRLVRAGFSEKRKQLKNNLRQLGLSDDEIAAALAGAGIDGRRRAETLTIEEWGRLSQTLDSATSART